MSLLGNGLLQLSELINGGELNGGSDDEVGVHATPVSTRGHSSRAH